MRRLVPVLSAAALLAAPGAARAVELTEPALRLPASSGGGPRVALTLDACSGETDQRILNVLVNERIAATIFVTARWIRRNRPALAVLKAHPELFEIENHGAMHLPAVDAPGNVFGLKTAGSPAAVAAEVAGGAQAIVAEGLPAPQWYRGATAEYSKSAIRQIEAMGYRVAGFSLNGDWGASAPARVAEQRISRAKDGDVVIAHINQPKRPAGQGVAAAILDLKKRGYRFLSLRDAASAAAAPQQAVDEQTLEELFPALTSSHGVTAPEGAVADELRRSLPPAQ